MHGTTGVGVGLGAGEGGRLLLFSSSSFCQPAPNVCQRSNALQSGHQLSSSGFRGVFKYVVFFWCTLGGVITLSRGHQQRSSIVTRICPFEINFTGSRSLEEMAEQLFLLTMQLSGP